MSTPSAAIGMEDIGGLGYVKLVCELELQRRVCGAEAAGRVTRAQSATGIDQSIVLARRGNEFAVVNITGTKQKVTSNWKV